MSDYSRKISIQTALIIEAIGRTRDICARSLEALRQPIPSTFLGNRIHPPPKAEEDRFRANDTAGGSPLSCEMNTAQSSNVQPS